MSQIGAHPWREAVPVETGRLILRAPTFADGPRLARYAGDLAVARMLARVPHPYTEAHASAFIGDVLASNAQGDGLGLAVARRKEPGALIGFVSFAREGEAAEIGWWFGPPYWGRGFATEAVAAMVALAFADPAVQRLTAGAFAGNAASLRVQQKLGFVRTGESRRMNLARGGPADHVDMGLTRATHIAFKDRP